MRTTSQTESNSASKRQREAPALQCSIFPCGMALGEDHRDVAPMGGGTVSCLSMDP